MAVMCVTITPGAAKYMRQMVRFSEGSATAGFRLNVSVSRDGFASRFSVVEKALPGDTVVEQNGALLFMAPETCILLQGYTIDYREAACGGGLVFERSRRLRGGSLPLPDVAAPVAFIRPRLAANAASGPALSQKA